MKTAHRYVLREHVGPFTFALSALTALLLLNYISRQFGTLVGKGLPASVIAKFFGLSVPFTFAMTLPMSVLVAVLYAFSRLAADNEITALKANGVSMRWLLVPVLIAAAALSAGMVAFNDTVLPSANHQLRTLQSDIARKKPTFGLRAQVINEVSPRRFFLRAGHIDQQNRMREVTIYDMSDPLRRRSIWADSGEMAFAPNGSDLLLTLHRGYMLEVPKAEPTRLQQLHFTTDFIRVEGVANQLDISGTDEYKSDREMSVCELQNEVSRYEHEYAVAQRNLEAALLASVREALSGVPAPPPEPTQVTVLNARPGSPAPRSRHFSVGRLYCDILSRIKGTRMPPAVRSLQAAELPSRSTASRPGVEAGRGPQVDSTARVDRPQGGVSQKADTVRAGSTHTDSTHPAIAPVVPGRFGGAGATPAVVPGAQGGVGTGARVVPPPQRFGRPQPTDIAGSIVNAGMRLENNRRQVNQNAVEIHKKFAISVACLVFVLVGAPIALRFPRGGVGVVIGVSMLVFALYYVGLIAGEALADRDILTPFFSMWVANMFLTAVGLVLFARMEREAATARGGDIHEMLDLLRSLFRRSRGEDAGAASVPHAGHAP